MADPDPIVTTPAAPAPEAAPVVPAATTVSAPTADVAAPPSAAPAVEGDQPAFERATDKPSLLEVFDTKQQADADAAEAARVAAAKPEDAKPGDAPKSADPAKPEDPAKPADLKPTDPLVQPVEAPAQLAPVEYKYELPETIKLDDATRTEFHGVLDKFRANPAEGAQELVTFHNKKMTEYADFLSREQHRAFNETRTGWQTDVLADPEIGGNGHQTAMMTIARVRDAIVPESDRAAFGDFMRITGAGDHPAFLRALHNAAKYIDEPQSGDAPANIKPSPNNGRSPENRRGILYDHPSSSKTM